MLSYTTLQNIIQIARMVIDIAIITLLVYYCLKIVRNNSRTVQIFKGVLFVVVMNAVAQFFGLQTVKVVADVLVQWGFLAVIIIFQPEIRGLLEKLGKSSVFSRMSSLSGNEREALVDELVEASMSLASQKVGALISIEQTQSLSDYVKTGTPMNAIVTADLLTSIFVTTTPLHDGAVIIQGDRIACASAYFLPTDRELPRKYGARHRAAVGISEITDSITIVVSEQAGTVSIARDGELTKMSRTSLRKYLLKVICNEEVEHGDTKIIKEDVPNSRVESIIDDLMNNQPAPIIIEKTEDYGEPEKVEKNEKNENNEGVLSIFRKKKDNHNKIEKESKKKPKKAPADKSEEKTEVKSEEPTTKVETVEKVEKPKTSTKKTPVKKEIDIDKDFNLEFGSLDDIDIDEVYKEVPKTPKKGGDK